MRKPAYECAFYAVCPWCKAEFYGQTTTGTAFDLMIHVQDKGHQTERYTMEAALQNVDEVILPKVMTPAQQEDLAYGGKTLFG